MREFTYVMWYYKKFNLYNAVAAERRVKWRKKNIYKLKKHDKQLTFVSHVIIEADHAESSSVIESMLKAWNCLFSHHIFWHYLQAQSQ